MKSVNSVAFDVHADFDGSVHMSFGQRHFSMSLDAVYDIQLQLAAFLAEIELDEYPVEHQADSNLSESKQILEFLASVETPRQLRCLN